MTQIRLPPALRDPDAATPESGGRLGRDFLEAFADWICLNPGEPIQSAAEHFGRSPNSLYAIRRSNTFQEILALKRKQYREIVGDSIAEKLVALADQGIDTLSKRLEDAENVSTKDLTAVTEMALTMAGFGQPKAPLVSVNVNAEALVQARERARQLNSEKTLEISTSGQSPKREDSSSPRLLESYKES